MRSPQETHAAIASQLAGALRDVFPIQAGNRQLHLVDVHPEPLPDPGDWNGQKHAAMENRTWGAPLRATVTLNDASGHVLDTKSVRLATLPAPTNRHTFLVDGREYQVSYQQRTKPGVYTKIDRTGAPAADFNLAKGRNFSVVLDPQSNQFALRYANTHIPLESVLRGIYGRPGIGLGGQFEHAVDPAAELGHLKTLLGEMDPRAPEPGSQAELKEAIRGRFASTVLDPKVTGLVLGSSHASVGPEALQAAARHVLEISRGERLPSGREQMAFKEIHGVEDFLSERIRKSRGLIQAKVRQKLDRANTLADLNLTAAFHPLVHQFFTQSSLSGNPVQVNPVEMIENAHKMTSLGEGGISDTHAIPVEVRNVHPSSAGFIDPVRTPDNVRAGVDVRTSIGARKVGKELQIQLLDRRGKRVWKTPAELHDQIVAHDQEPDEAGFTRAIHRGQLVDAKTADINYRLPTGNMFTPSTALVPFINSGHAHRSAMGAKMLGQALSLVEREAPLVTTEHGDHPLRGILAHSPVGGRIAALERGKITVQDENGKRHVVPYPHEFPLNGGSFLHGQPLVAAGDRVKAGQRLIETNFDRGGHLALGHNAIVAYLPYKGLNYEDGMVVTQQGASKLTSQHLHTEEARKDERSVHDLKRFKGHFSTLFDNRQFGQLDTDGVIRVGSELHEGDPVLATMRARIVNPEQQLLGKVHKTLLEPYRDTSVTWDKPYPGKVTAVAKSGQHIKVTIQSAAPAMVGDKVANRFGGKGVITAIIPDHEAPHTADGQIPDVIINPAAIPSRMNNSQVFELAAAKAAKKLGLPRVVIPHFPGVDNHTLVSDLVRKAGVEPDEEMFDPQTGRSLGKVLIGPEYMLKLFKQAETGFSARAGGRYDLDLRPAKGGEEGAKSVGYLDLFGLLGHGARDMIRENATLKAEYRPDVLAAMWQGRPLPAPQPTFAWRKFEAMLRGSGVDVKKEGSKLMLLPMTDRATLALSHGQIHKPLTVMDKPDPHTGLPFRPEAGGLFDPHVTGGLVGERWGHFTLAEPVVSPLFARPARLLLGMSQQDFEGTMREHGGEEIARQLGKIDPESRIKELNSQLKKTSSPARRDAFYKQLRYLKPLAAQGLSPDEAYVVRHVPVLPPSMRPLYPDAATGQLMNSDANVLYQRLLMTSEQLEHHRSEGDPETAKELRGHLFDALAKVQGLDPVTEALTRGHEPQGFLKLITGSRAKEGFFQSKLVSRRQDVAGRAVAVPNPTLGLDEIGLPDPMAWKLYRHHAIGQLTAAGYPLDRAAEHLEQQSEVAKKALLAAMAEHPVVMTRAPSLHRFNLQAFKPLLVTGKHVQTNTLINKGFNLDHDGDAVNMHVPVTPEATRDAWRMLPSNNLFSALNRSPMHVPGQEAIQGLYQITRPQGTPRKFRTKADAAAAYSRGEIGLADPIELG